MATSISFPIQGERLLNHIVDELARTSPEKLYAEYPISPTGYDKGFQKITFADLANAVNGLAWWLHDAIGPGKNFETLTYIGPLDLRYNALILGAVKAGYKVLLASPRNSLPAHINLFNLLNCQKIITPSQRPQAVTTIVESHSIQTLEIPTVEELLSKSYTHYAYSKTFEEAKKDPLVVLHTSGTTGLPKPIIWTHEFAASWLQWVNLEGPPGFTNQHTLWSPGRLFFLFPPFHAASMFASLLGAIFRQCILIYPPSGLIPSAQTLVDGLKHTKADCAAVVPLVLEELCKKPLLLDVLSQNLPTMFYSGGTVGQTIGDKISKKLKLFSIIGTTEVGLFPTLYPTEIWPTGEWNYFRFNSAANVEFRHESGDEYEAVVVRHPDPAQEQPVFKVFPEKTEYRTGDLYTPHPSSPDLWRYRGRDDDIIVFLTGEKTNPTSMEQKIATHPQVQSALVIGTLRFQAGLLIELVTEDYMPTAQRAEFIELLWPIIQEANLECPRHAQVKKSHIMFIDPQRPMLRSSKGTVQRKATLRLYEKEIDDLYADADKMSTFEPGEDLGPPVDSSDANAISSFISQAVIKIMNIYTDFANDKNENFFLSGMDSLQALQLTRQLKAALSLPDLDISTVYANPSIHLLTQAILKLSEAYQTTAAERQASITERVEKMLGEYELMVDEFARSSGPKTSTSVPTTDFDVLSPITTTADVSKKERVVLLTGSTGAIGCYILSILLATPDIFHVYCLNRASNSMALQIQRSQARGLPTEFPSDRVTFLTADLSQNNLNLEWQVYERLRCSVTHIVHNAWPVNFNLSLSTFAPHLMGVCNLIKLAAEAGSTTTSNSCNFLFVSSVSSVAGAAVVGKQIPEKIITDPHAPLPMGYGQSKYIAERILDYASRAIPTFRHNGDDATSSSNIAILRVGQVAGPAYAPGSWNKWEWFPSLVISSLYLGLIPDSLGGGTNDIIDWVPIDVLAESVVELLLGLGRQQGTSSPPTTTASIQVFHPLNPKPTTWRKLQAVIIDALKKYNSRTLPSQETSEGGSKNITVVPLSTWISHLHSFSSSLSSSPASLEEILAQNPALKLLSFYESLLASSALSSRNDNREEDDDGSIVKCGKLDGKLALEASETLRALGSGNRTDGGNGEGKGIEDDWVRRWVRDWVGQKDGVK